MLYLCLYLPELALEALAPPPDTATAVVDKKGANRWLTACCPKCGDLGIQAGMAVTTALALAPDLRTLDRRRTREAAALQSLATWAEQYSNWISIDADRMLLWLEIGSSLRCFGGLDVLFERIATGVKSLGYTARLGVAPTFEAAAVVASVGAEAITTDATLVKRLASFPIASLYLNADSLDVFRGLGLRTIGELLAMPLDGLARRMGPKLTHYLMRLDGRATDARIAYRPPPKYQRSFELWGPVETFEGLQFPLRRIFTELEGFLRSRDVAVQRLAIDFHHEKGIPPTRVELRTTKPLRDAQVLLALLREHVERTELVAPTESIRLRAPRLVPLGETQGALFAGDGRREGDWSALLDRLRARLGEDSVQHLGLRSDHRPEKAWCLLPLDQKLEEATADPRHERPLWLMTPRRLQYLPERLGRPERIEAGWWEGDHIRRDYYVAKTDEGAQWWLYREADSGSWYLHGLWA